MARKKQIQPSAAEVAFNLFAKLTVEERDEFASSVYGRSLFSALESLYKGYEYSGSGGEINGQPSKS